MLPKIDANGGRQASRRDFLNSRSGADAAVVPLPRLRLLKQVGGSGEDSMLPTLEKMGAPPARRLLLARVDSGDNDSRRVGSDNVQPARRGRGLLRPLDDRGQALLSQPPRLRSPPPEPKTVTSPLQEDSLQEDAAALLQQRARERVKEQRRQRRRQAREEEERRQQDEQERTERAQRAVGQIEAHRRELARQAADRARRSREDREDRALEREELQSARRQRMRRYQTPSQIRELIGSNQRPASGGSRMEDDGELKDVSAPRRAARAPSADAKEVRERRRGSRGRARNGLPRKEQPSDAEQLAQNDAEVEDQHRAPPVDKPESLPMQQPAVTTSEERSANATHEGSEQAVAVEAPPLTAPGDTDDIRHRLRDALDHAIGNGELEKAVHLHAIGNA